MKKKHPVEGLGQSVVRGISWPQWSYWKFCH